MDKERIIARSVSINGIVQGVGFRPFTCRLARRYLLKGEIANTSGGVSIHIEGKEGAVEGFLNDLGSSPPALAEITDLFSVAEEIRGYRSFSIARSKAGENISTLISPDVSICDDCLRELFDPRDRRYRYPFINCTNCGPRYSIINDIPYDRPNTSMKNFKMCKKCSDEYEDMENRRFHAQPNACNACGPHAVLYGNRRKRVDAKDALRKTACLLKDGYIIAVKGLGGFHLAVDAENDEAVRRLRERKMREEKPFAVMSSGLEQVSRYALFDNEDADLLTAIQRPIVLLKKKEKNPLSEWISPRSKYYGVMLPCTPLHYLILDNSFIALVMTSGNVSEEPIAIDNEEAFERLSGIADFFVVHDRDIIQRSDDSIINPRSGTITMIRRSRGYVPVPLTLKNNIPGILGCGAGLKNTICMTKDNRAFLSQHIGDLENRAAYDSFRTTVEHMKRILDINPEIIACDLNPDYLSTRYAIEQDNMQLTRVQHHHAHIAGCMAENRLDGDLIGISFDGTGYGPDGTIWGGEIMAAGMKGYKRVSTISPVPMPGSASVIKEPWRMGVSYLYRLFGVDLLDLDIPMIKEIPRRDIEIIMEMISKKINAPLTSSLGRLFDGVSAICGIRTRVYNEGQAAMEIEREAVSTHGKCYGYRWEKHDDIYYVDPDPLIGGIVRDVTGGTDVKIISGKFHETLINMYSGLCGIISSDTGLDRVVLSGGVFQNSILLRGLSSALKNRGLRVYTNKLVPPNDGGISLGQAAIAAACSV